MRIIICDDYPVIVKNLIRDIKQIVPQAECAGFSKATKARLDGSKLRALGWRARYNLEEGLKRTLGILS